MQFRDMLLDQIEQINKVLAKIMSDFLGLKHHGKVSYGIEVSNETLKSELDIDSEEILNLDEIELDKLFNDRNFKAQHIEILAEYFLEWGKNEISTNREKAKQIIHKSLQLIELSQSKTKTYSMATNETKESIIVLLDTLS